MSRKGGKKQTNKKVHPNKWEKFSQADAVKSRMDAEDGKLRPTPTSITFATLQGGFPSSSPAYSPRTSDPSGPKIVTWDPQEDSRWDKVVIRPMGPDLIETYRNNCGDRIIYKRKTGRTIGL